MYQKLLCNTSFAAVAPQQQSQVPRFLAWPSVFQNIPHCCPVHECLSVVAFMK